ncbi:hypothetical protein D9M72_526760 [compost metagenome]
MLAQKLAAPDAADPVFPVEREARRAVGFQHRRGFGQGLEALAGGAAAGAIAGGADDRFADGFKGNQPAAAGGNSISCLWFHHGPLPTSYH